MYANTVPSVFRNENEGVTTNGNTLSAPAYAQTIYMIRATRIVEAPVLLEYQEE